jgi:hypothetical protein
MNQFSIMPQCVYLNRNSDESTIMSSSTFTSTQKQLLENKREILIARYEAISKQRLNTLNEGDKIPLSNQLHQLKTEIKELEVQLLSGSCW